MVAAALSLVAAFSVQAQDTSSTKPKPPVKKDTSKTASGVIEPMTVEDSLAIEWYVPTGTTCSTVDASAAKAVTIKSDLYTPESGLITPDSAKIVALCAVPGQIGSGRMEVADGRTTYKIDIIPNQKKTHTDVVVDATTGAVMSSKQFGGLRGLAGWVRVSAEHKMNKKNPDDTTMRTKPPI
jgi:uncharacterized membrane protein YkoI